MVRENLAFFCGLAVEGFSGLRENFLEIFWKKDFLRIFRKKNFWLPKSFGLPKPIISWKCVQNVFKTNNEDLAMSRKFYVGRIKASRKSMRRLIISDTERRKLLHFMPVLCHHRPSKSIMKNSSSVINSPLLLTSPLELLVNCLINKFPLIHSPQPPPEFNSNWSRKGGFSVCSPRTFLVSFHHQHVLKAKKVLRVHVKVSSLAKLRLIK